MSAVLGGGISGLSAAFYICERRFGQPVLFEASDRLGGWIRSVESENGAIFEVGPRMIRPKGESGKNTLRLIDKLELSDKVLPILRNEPSAKNRMICVNDKLYTLPNSLSSLFRRYDIFDGALIKILWRDLNSPRVSSEDESMYSFTERRFGKDIADNLISPMLCGICAGDSKKISVNMIMSGLFEAEQKHGSVVKGLLIEWLKHLVKPTKLDANENAHEVHSKSVDLASAERWATWGLKGGFEQLPKRLSEKLKVHGADIRLKEKCVEMTFRDNCVELMTDKSKIPLKFSNVISSLSAKNLAPLLERQHPQLARELAGIPLVTVAVVNLEFPGKSLTNDAFGFLVPPNEKSPILGVIFDSCMFPNESSTVLTVMMGGAWFEEYFGSSPDKEYLLKVAVEHSSRILGIKSPPKSHNVAILKDCIAQHVVGHKQRLNRIQNYISGHGLPLALCGSSYQGIGVNDVILSAKQAVFHIFDKDKIC